MPELPPRFWEKVTKTGSCWLWTAAKSHGYGRFRVDRKSLISHRLSYENSHGPIPEGMDIDHICHIRACVNPSHLRVTTRKQNMENLNRAHVDSKTGIRGVSWSKRNSKWVVQVCHSGVHHFGGYFADLEDAEEAAVRLRNGLYTHNDLDRKVTNHV